MHVCPVRPVLVHGYVQVPLMAALSTARATMDAHRGVAAVAEQGLGFLRNLSVAEANEVSWWDVFRSVLVHLLAWLFACMCPACVCCCVQVPLMAALPAAQAAMDAHRGVAAVTERGLHFLWYLAIAEANRVSLWA